MKLCCPFHAAIKKDKIARKKNQLLITKKFYIFVTFPQKYRFKKTYRFSDSGNFSSCFDYLFTKRKTMDQLFPV